MKSVWTNTPFSTIEEAHQVAEAMGMAPTAIISQGDVRTFSVLKGKVTLFVAQRASGPPAPVKQKEVGSKLARRPVDPNAPHWGEHDRLGVSPWTSTEHASLVGAVEHRRRNVTNFEPPVLTGTLIVFAEPKGEYIEYLDTGEGMVGVRVLRPLHPSARVNDGYIGRYRDL